LSNEVRRFAEQNMVGTSGRQRVSWQAFENLELTLPPLPTQTAIAEILSSLDDKIELNNKINQELEDLAQTFFKQWFIDFEFPNENGEPYKSSGGEMVVSELGKIPKGWEVRSLIEIARINLGGTPSRSKTEYWNGYIPWVNSGAINENYILKPTEFISEVGLKKSSTKVITKYSTLIAITGATLGQVSYSLIDACYNQSVISLTSESNINEFIHLLIISIIPELIKHQTGGAQQHINKGNVESFKVKYPDENLLNEFKSLIADLYCRIEINLRENQALTDLRDTLLPKLISGELEVFEALTLTSE
jgi:type I restriction enzyme S subunit